MGKKKLNKRQAMFCREYIVDFNATAAAKRAGYSVKTAYSQGHDLLKHPEVQKRIKKLMKKREEKVSITAEMVVEELAKIATLQEVDFYNKDGSVKRATELSDAQRSALKSYHVRSIRDGKKKDGSPKYRDVPVFTVHSKDRALELLGKHFALFVDVKKVDLDVTEKRSLGDYYAEEEAVDE